MYAMSKFLVAMLTLLPLPFVNSLETLKIQLYTPNQRVLAVSLVMSQSICSKGHLSWGKKGLVRKNLWGNTPHAPISLTLVNGSISVKGSVDQI